MLVSYKRVVLFFPFFLLVLSSSAFGVGDLCDEDQFGEMFIDDPITVVIGTKDIYHNVTGFEETNMKGVTFDNVTFGGDVLIIGESGIYLVWHYESFNGGANTEYHVAISLNGEDFQPCEIHRKIGTGNDVGSAGTTCIMNLTAGDRIGLMFENEDNTNNAVVQHINVGVSSYCSENNDKFSWMYLIGFLVWAGLFLVGKIVEDRTFVVLSGLWMMFLGVGLFRVGVPNLDGFMLNGLVIVLVGLGFYLVLSPVFEDKFGMGD